MEVNFKRVPGVCDFNPAQTLIFNKIATTCRKIFTLFGYKEIILPILEERKLFIRGVGQETDIVQKQIFKIEGKDIILRPEGTAQVVRYYLQQGLDGEGSFHKFFYVGPMFRGERPQRGRLRQFHHIGVEAIGSSNVYVDAEIVYLAVLLLEKLNLKNFSLQINSLGCDKDKEDFSRKIKASLFSYQEKLCSLCKRRLQLSPLRVLDCKNENCQKLIKKIISGEKYLCSLCDNNFNNLRKILDNFKIKYTYDPYLVRGLDYYTNFVFEITVEKLGSGKAISAGGRYNSLIKNLGGKDTPACGFALGVERVMLSLPEEKKQENLDVFVAIQNNFFLREAFSLTNILRDESIISDMDFLGRSLKGQLREANRRGAKAVVILAEEEQKKEEVVLKDMQKGFQKTVSKNNLVDELKKILT